MKLVFRGSDVGYSKFCDEGFFKAADEGVVSSCNIMLDGRSAVSALKKLKERPWISVEWHRQFWYKPVLPVEQVPSLVNEEGRFKWGHKHIELWNEVKYEEAYQEMVAELELCKSYLGRYPDMAAGPIDDGVVFNDAFRDVCDAYKIPINVCESPFYSQRACYQSSHYVIRAINPGTDRTPLEIQERGMKLKYFDEYDPAQLILDSKFSEENSYMISIHPGFVDDIILKESSMTLHRVKEVECAMDVRVLDWIKENKFELANTRDVLYRSHEYQDHLKDIKSPLWKGCF